MQLRDLRDLPEPLHAPLLACARGELAPNIALMHLCIAAPDAPAVADAVSAASRHSTAPGIVQLERLWRAKPESFNLVKTVLATDNMTDAALSPEDRIEACARTFDAAAALSPEAGVALYALGDSALLAAATGEIVDAMQTWNLLGRERVALEIGCGNGRFLKALAPRLRWITGIDISPAMIAAARERCRHLSNVDVLQTSGRDLAGIGDSSIDLVLAIDSFPYLVRCGADLVQRHFAEAARVLQPAGRMVILNYSYRQDFDLDRMEALEHAGQNGFSLTRASRHDFHLWDGTTLLLTKTAT
jgi:hypothetical protein